MPKIAWLLGCIILSGVVLGRAVPAQKSSLQRAVLIVCVAVLSGAFLYYVGAIASTFFWGA